MYPRKLPDGPYFSPDACPVCVGGCALCVPDYPTPADSQKKYSAVRRFRESRLFSSVWLEEILDSADREIARPGYLTITAIRGAEGLISLIQEACEPSRYAACEALRALLSAVTADDDWLATDMLGLSLALLSDAVDLAEKEE